MIGKSIRLAAVLAAAVGIPYAWTNPQITNTVKTKWKDLKGGFASSRGGGDSSFAFSGSGFEPQSSIPTALDADGPPLTGEVQELKEILRFDVSPQWVMQNWGRVSTILSESNLEGLRVPLVTGTDVTSVTGSLTYYFDMQQQVRRITLDGHTGDGRELVEIATEQFKLRPDSALGAGLYVAKWNGKPTSVLRISHAPVVRANSPHARLSFSLELNQPRAGYNLSAATQQRLNLDQQSNRW
jgi:hypothetical protein